MHDNTLRELALIESKLNRDANRETLSVSSAVSLGRGCTLCRYVICTEYAIYSPLFHDHMYFGSFSHDTEYGVHICTHIYSIGTSVAPSTLYV